MPFLLEFKKILDRISHEDKVGHLFVVDIKFHDKTQKTMLFNEIYTPIFEKNKVIQEQHRSVLHLMSVISRNKEKDLVRTFKANAKTHSTLEEEKIIPLYAAHIHFLVKRAGCLITKIYQHFTFEQSKFKKDFVVKNQKSRQIAKINVEKDFYKLLNNSNFGMNCRSNIDNRTLEPIYDEISEIAFIKKCDNIFDNEEYFQFSDINIMTEEINEKFDRLLLGLDKNDTTYLTRKYYLDSQREQDLDSIKTMEEKKKRSGAGRAFHDIGEKIDHVSKSRTTKMIVDF